MDERFVEQAEELTRRLTEAEQARIGKVIAAARPADWDGLCLSCGREVPHARVAATNSCLCVRCKTIEERRSWFAR